jgi:hypothetical protein
VRTTPPSLRALRDDTSPLHISDLRERYELEYLVLHWAWAFGLTGPDFYRLATGAGHLHPDGYPRWVGWP